MDKYNCSTLVAYKLYFYTKYYATIVHSSLSYSLRTLRAVRRQLKKLLSRDLPANTMLSVEDTWGVASLRQCSGFPVSEYEYQAPLGCSIVTWNIKTKERTSFQAHDNLITVMRKNISNQILTCSYDGQVKIWNDQYKLLAGFNIPSKYVVEANWSMDGQQFGVCTNGSKQMLVVYDLKSVISGAVKPKWIQKAPQKKAGKEADFDCFYACLFKQNSNVLAIYQSSKMCEVFEFSNDGKLLRNVVVSPLKEDINIMLCTSNINNNLFAIGLENGIFGVYSSSTLDLKSVIQATGSPEVCLWNGNELVTTSYITGVMTWWDQDGKLLREVKGGPDGSIVHMDLSTTSNHSYWIGGIMSLHKLTLSDDQTKITEQLNLSFLQLTGCGISVSETNMVASGDFTGNVMLWKTGVPLPYQTTTINTQVRCLLWFQNMLLVGSLNGEVYSWNCSQSSGSSSKVSELYHFNGGVVTMKMSNNMKYLAVGTTGGYLYIFTISVKDGKVILGLVYQGIQHEPKKSPDGTLVPMEIWSLAWKPDDSLIVTTSEDYTSAVADPMNGKITNILKGHTTAVTSADWKILSNGSKCVLITCADDKTCRIYDGETFQLLKVVNTYDIYGWHTLTYMCINSEKDLLICSTQNGYVVMWDLSSYKKVYEEKLHDGSIEGLVLDMKQEHLYTVGSDCAVNAFIFGTLYQSSYFHSRCKTIAKL